MRNRPTNLIGRAGSLVSAAGLERAQAIHQTLKIWNLMAFFSISFATKASVTGSRCFFYWLRHRASAMRKNCSEQPSPSARSTNGGLLPLLFQKYSERRQERNGEMLC